MHEVTLVGVYVHADICEELGGSIQGLSEGEDVGLEVGGGGEESYVVYVGPGPYGDGGASSLAENGVFVQMFKHCGGIDASENRRDW